MRLTYLAGRSGWRGPLGLVLGLSVARVAYLVWLCPYELVADEAHYWDWSRRVELSYYSKGPGVAWAIRASTALLGQTEAAIRFPAVVAAAIAAVAVAALARGLARPAERERAGWLGALLVSLVPAYQGAALLMTIDGPYVACWALACLLAWRLRERLASGGGGALWPALGLALGVGFLFKYTILLLVPGLLAFAFPRRRPARRWAAGLVACAATFLAAVTPVVAWNAAHGWPTVAHLLGRVGAPGGDEPVRAVWRYSPLATLDLLGSQLGLIGPLLVLALALALRDARAREAGALFAVACAAPVLLFYLALTLVSKAQGNWPIAGYLTPVAWAAARLAGSPVPRLERALRLCVAWGVATGLGMLALGPLARVPALARVVPLHRLTGHRERARQVEAVLEAERARGGDPFVLATGYGETSLLAYYLPSRPRVLCASHAFGGRRTAYDYFADTALDAPRSAGARRSFWGRRPPPGPGPSTCRAASRARSRTASW